MQFDQMNQRLSACLGLVLASLPCWSLSASGSEFPISQPLDETVMIHEQLTSGESDEVPPEPVPPGEYQPLDMQTPALVAEEIMRLRDALGTSPLSDRLGFRPLTLANESDEDEAAPAPWQREDDRRDFRERLRGMASRPVLPQPVGVPYGVTPYRPDRSVFSPQHVPYAYVQPQPVQVPYGFEPGVEVYAAPVVSQPVSAEKLQSLRQIEVLRQTAHQLDQTAHQLECCEQFERADQVRQLAEQLRQDARQCRRAVEATAMHTVRPAMVENPYLIRARSGSAYSAQAVEGSAFNPGVRESLESGFTDSDPSCPACPTQRASRRAKSSEQEVPRHR